MNTNKKNKNVKMNKSIDYLENNNSIDAAKNDDNKGNINSKKSK